MSSNTSTEHEYPIHADTEGETETIVTKPPRQLDPQDSWTRAQSPPHTTARSSSSLLSCYTVLPDSLPAGDRHKPSLWNPPQDSWGSRQLDRCTKPSANNNALSGDSLLLGRLRRKPGTGGHRCDFPGGTRRAPTKACQPELSTPGASARERQS